MDRRLIQAGSLLAFFGVALGAFGTHGLQSRLSTASIATWHTAVEYHLIHSVAILTIAVLGMHAKHQLVALSGWLLTAGVLVFSGTLYAYALTGVIAFVMVTPLGGLALLSGWLCLVVGIGRAEPA